MATTLIGYQLVKELPFVLQDALRAVGYGRKDIAVNQAESVSIADMGSTGRRGFVALVNLDSEEYKLSYGSWGGPNPYAAPPVDRDTSDHKLPENGAVIRGCEGGSSPVSASVYVHASRIAKMLPAVLELEERHKRILAVHRSIKAGDYRKEELRRLKATSDDLDMLVSCGFLSRNAKGSVQITTQGKNACAGVNI